MYIPYIPFLSLGELASLFQPKPSRQHREAFRHTRLRNTGIRRLFSRTSWRVRAR
ncbi:predicted protein [Plenodomus lingam JN3]|uniref:Predicted protein n=1 Tax=Leptosphaeria maculans (strain JN3 / isolate v23.1.3 / race Av1-4-5-6-7-8) TaxID=985895 RepID=E4ZHI0_LEPMJ|nr:predicted protein [Plenodomus lingam JN3]CBX90813.1 predicted protein [Plenodomus lingam JN3]